MEKELEECLHKSLFFSFSYIYNKRNMSLKLGNILKTELDEKLISEIFTVGKGDMFKDYVPISFFQSPQYTELILNNKSYFFNLVKKNKKGFLL